MSQGNQRSSNSMKRCKNLEPIPTDLIMEIFSRLPSKSIARFRSVSKLWGSMLRSPYFTELFMTRSSARPRLLFVVKRDSEWLFYSSPQPQNPYDKSLVVAADFHTKFHGQMYREDACNYASGLIYFPDFIWISQKAYKAPMICNPITGQYAILPKLGRYKKSSCGFDPIDKQFKVLAEAYPFCDEKAHHEILTLGTEKLRWRKNSHCPIYNHSNLCDGVCINGVLYYLVEKIRVGGVMIVCFDVRSEKFKFIESECICFFNKVKNYKGKLCGIGLRNDDIDSIELRMWVLEDVEKQEWSKHVYTLPKHELVDSSYLFIAGVTITGEIVLSMKRTCNPFYVFYFNPKKNTFHCVEIQLQGDKEDHEWFDNHRVYTFVDHVEYLNFSIMKTISPPEQSTSTSSRKYHQVRIGAHLEQNRRKFESVNKFDALCLLDDDEFTGVKT